MTPDPAAANHVQVATESSNEGGPRLACEGITVRYGGLVALDAVDLTVPPGMVVGLVGPNGAGKSTLFGVVSGLVRPTSGSVTLDGADITSSRAQTRAELGLARTFQHPELFAGLTVRDHLVLAHRERYSRHRIWADVMTLGSLHDADPVERRTVDELLELLGLEDFGRRPAIGLPLGTARLVELGRAIARSPSLLLLDEPSSGLDSTETVQFEHTVQRLVKESDTSVLLVEHDVDLVMRMSSTVYVLDFGRMIASGPPAAVLASEAVRTAYLGEAVDDATSESRQAGATDTAPRPTVSTANVTAISQLPALAVDGLAVRYGGARALRDVSFALGRGQVLAVLGPNGAGKSSLARALSGLVRPSAGTAVLGSHDLAHLSAHAARRAGVVHLPEGRGVFRELTVIENLRMAVTDVPGGRAARRAAMDVALDLFPNLAARRRQLAGRLSGGEQQMLSLARALAVSPQLVIADELSLGLAPLMVDMVFDSLDQARQLGVTVIMIEQYVYRALAFADECLVLNRGEAVWQGPADRAGKDVLRHYLGDAMTSTE